MRFFFLLLCLANAVWFFWELHSGAFNAPTSGDSTAPPILLVSERENARRGAAISAIVDRYSQRSLASATQEVSAFFSQPHDLQITQRDPQAEDSKARENRDRSGCLRIGPFADRLEMRRWLAAKSLTAVDSYSDEFTVPGDFQVYFPPARDAEQLRINKMMLRAKGLTDFWPIPSGDLKSALSLGVFTEKSRAILYRDQLVKLGIVAAVRQRNRIRPVWYALIRQGVVDRLQDDAVTVTDADCRSHRIGE